MSPRNACSVEVDRVGTYRTLPSRVKEVDHGAASMPATPVDPESSPSKELAQELSHSAEDFTELNIAPGLLKITNLNESFKAYSDSQLVPQASSSSNESVKQDGAPSPSPTCMATLNPFCFNSASGTNQNRHHVRAKLSSAKLHLKSLFGQVSGEVSINI